MTHAKPVIDRSEVWYAIPSANPELARRTLPLWREMGYKVAVLQNWTRGEIPADRCVWRDAYPGWPGSINILCREVVPKTAGIVVSGGDDMLPDPTRTAQQLAREFFERFPDGFGVMQPQGDDYMAAAHYCGSPWFGRAWIDASYRGQGPMPSGYNHNWADLELYWVARGMGALWTRDDVAQHHEHFWRAGEAPPPYWQANVRPGDRADVQRYLARKWLGFPGCEPEPGVLPAARRFDPAVLDLDTQCLAERHWMNHYGGAAASWGAKMTRALQQCAERGWSRVALYGAGTHTRALGAELASPPVHVVCVLDDDQSRHGQTLWNIPIVSPASWETHRLDAVILSSNSMEDRLWEASAPMRRRGLPVVRLYEKGEGMWRGDHDPRLAGAI